MIRPGELRDYVTLQKQGDMTSAGTPGPWGNVESFYAKITPLDGRELISAQALASPVTTVIKTYYIKGVTPAMRLTLQERVFNIKNVIDVEEKHEELKLYCVEVQ